MKTKYTPKPIDTSSIDIPDDLSHLVEKLAEHAHDVWAEGRLNDGWKWGVERCDKTLMHPCLIPYSALPEIEKEYDRRVVMQTIKAILALGYPIG